MCSDEFYGKLLVAVAITIAVGIFALGFLAGSLIF